VCVVWVGESPGVGGRNVCGMRNNSEMRAAATACKQRRGGPDTGREKTWASGVCARDKRWGGGGRDSRPISREAKHVNPGDREARWEHGWTAGYCSVNALPSHRIGPARKNGRTEAGSRGATREGSLFEEESGFMRRRGRPERFVSFARRAAEPVKPRDDWSLAFSRRMHEGVAARAWPDRDGGGAVLWISTPLAERWLGWPG
jgi:hypothetical protein